MTQEVGIRSSLDLAPTARRSRREPWVGPERPVRRWLGRCRPGRWSASRFGLIWQAVSPRSARTGAPIRRDHPRRDRGVHRHGRLVRVCSPVSRGLSRRSSCGPEGRGGARPPLVALAMGSVVGAWPRPGRAADRRRPAGRQGWRGGHLPVSVHATRSALSRSCARCSGLRPPGRLHHAGTTWVGRTPRSRRASFGPTAGRRRPRAAGPPRRLPSVRRRTDPERAVARSAHYGSAEAK